MSSSSSKILQSVEGEISFFRSVMRARPVGIHRHFHVLAIRNAIQKDTGQLVSMDDVWMKLRDCYDLEALEGLVRIQLPRLFYDINSHDVGNGWV